MPDKFKKHGLLQYSANDRRSCGSSVALRASPSRSRTSRRDEPCWRPGGGWADRMEAAQYVPSRISSGPRLFLMACSAKCVQYGSNMPRFRSSPFCSEGRGSPHRTARPAPRSCGSATRWCASPPRSSATTSAVRGPPAHHHCSPVPDTVYATIQCIQLVRTLHVFYFAEHINAL